MGNCTATCVDECNTLGRDEIEKLRLRRRKDNKKRHAKRYHNDEESTMSRRSSDSDISIKKLEAFHEASSECSDSLKKGHDDSLVEMADQLGLEMQECDGCQIFIHNRNTLLLDATSFQMIDDDCLKLFNIFKDNESIKSVIITSCNFTESSHLLIKALRDILTADSKRIRIVECELPSKVSEKDLKILEINSKDHNIASLDVINCQLSLGALETLNRIVKSLSVSSKLNVSIREEDE